MTNIQTKICGVTCLADAQLAIEAGADAIGLNFYPQSKRYVAAEAAAEICQPLVQRAAFVGVFVNASSDQVSQTVEQVGLTHVQFHGDESMDQVAEIKQRFPDVIVIRAVRTKSGQLQAAKTEIQKWQSAGADMMLLDAAAVGAFGGTGETLDWPRVGQLEFRVPWLLAGGLGPENVAEAIRLAGPDGVDVASGVEIEPGRKCPEKVAAFIRAAKESFAS